MRVPDIAETPGDKVGSQFLVKAIVHSIHCEIKDAITYAIDHDKKTAKLNHGVRNAPWLDKWGIQVSLTLTIEESTDINPSSMLMPSPAAGMTMFTLAGALDASSTATRIDTLGYFYTVKDVYAAGPCEPAERAVGPGSGSLLIQSDLGLKEWLETQIFLNGTDEIKVPTTAGGKDTMSHQVTFKVVTSGNVTPAYKLVHVAFNQSGNLLAVGRERTHDLVITLGPVDSSEKGLVGSAAGSYLASQIAIAIRNRPANGLLR